MLNLQSTHKKYSDISINTFKHVEIPCCKPLNVLSDFFNFCICLLDFSYSTEI